MRRLEPVYNKTRFPGRSGFRLIVLAAASVATSALATPAHAAPVIGAGGGPDEAEAGQASTSWDPLVIGEEDPLHHLQMRPDGDYQTTGIAHDTAEPCTQQEDSADEEEVPRLVRWVGGALDAAQATELPRVAGGVLTVGRAPSNDLVLNSTLVHGRHAEISLGAGGAYSLHLVSNTHLCTFIEEVPQQHIKQQHTAPDVLLADGDTLRFGGTRLQNYQEFVYCVVAPEATQPDRNASPLVPAPARRSKPRAAYTPTLPPSAPAGAMAPPPPRAAPPSPHAAPPPPPGGVSSMSGGGKGGGEGDGEGGGEGGGVGGGEGSREVGGESGAASPAASPAATAAADQGVGESGTASAIGAAGAELPPTSASSTSAPAPGLAGASGPAPAPTLRGAGVVAATSTSGGGDGGEEDGKRDAASPAAATANSSAMLRGRAGARDVTLATMRRHRTPLGLAGAPVAHIVATRDLGFDLHVQTGGAVAIAPPVVTPGFEEPSGAPGDWKSLGAGAQRALKPGWFLRVGNAEYVCDFPAARTAGPSTSSAPARLSASSAPAQAPAALTAGRAARVEELGYHTLRSAQIRAELTAGNSGAHLRDTQRGVSAAQEALETVAVSAGGTPEQLAQALRAAAGKLKKVVNDSSKKRRRAEVSHDRAVQRAERRDGHAAPVPRAKHMRPATGKRDKRSYDNRTGARKRRRVQEDERRGGKGSGKGGGGGGNYDGGRSRRRGRRDEDA